METEARVTTLEAYQGLIFALLTTLLWGVQPFFMKVALLQYTPISLSWFRLTFAGGWLFCWWWAVGRVPRSALRELPCIVWAAGLGLGINYFTFLEAIQHGGPALTQVLIQIGPLMLALIGVVVYRERLSTAQSLGALLALIGFSLFYSDRLGTSDSPGGVAVAAGYVLVAALSWVLYCLVQKNLAKRFNVQVINMAVYLTAGVTLVGLVTWSNFLEPISWPSAALLYLSVSTVLAYGALAESLARLPLSRVTCVIMCNPLITLLGVELFRPYGFHWAQDGVVSWYGYVGAMAALLGVAVTVLVRSR
jgi:drug/metabolite transporter (DMT)-like permease